MQELLAGRAMVPATSSAEHDDREGRLLHLDAAPGAGGGARSRPSPAPLAGVERRRCSWGRRPPSWGRAWASRSASVRARAVDQPPWAGRRAPRGSGRTGRPARPAPTTRPATARPSAARSRIEPVDLGLGADVDAAGRLVEQQDAAVAQQPAGQHDLLLVAAGQLGDQPLGVVGRVCEEPRGASGGSARSAAPVEERPGAGTGAGRRRSRCAPAPSPARGPGSCAPRGRGRCRPGWPGRAGPAGAPGRRTLDAPASGRSTPATSRSSSVRPAPTRPADAEDLARRTPRDRHLVHGGAPGQAHDVAATTGVRRRCRVPLREDASAELAGRPWP